MAVTGTYYIDGATLSLASAAYSDAALTTPAPDGYYSDGSVVRRQLGGVFVTLATCESCSAPCGQTLVYSGGQGIYTAPFDAGLGTGCIIIYFRPNTKVHGIRAKRGVTTYNKLTSVFDGYHGSTTSGNYTFVGNAIYDCGVAAALSGGGYSGLDEYVWNGSIFALTGSSGVVTGAAGDVSYSAGNPSWMTLRVPKTAATPRDVSVEIVAPCATGAFDLQVNCPVLLTGFAVSERYPLSTDPNDLCNFIVTPYPNTLYNIPNFGSSLGGQPSLHEFVTQDQIGSVFAASGYYKVAPSFSGGWFDPFVIRVQNGVIDFVQDPCPI